MSSAHNVFCDHHSDSVNQAAGPGETIFSLLRGSACQADGMDVDCDG